MTSISLTARSKLTPEKIFQRAETYFGSEYGLECTKKTEETRYFEGGGGFVDLRAVQRGKFTNVELSGREWTFEIERFLRTIAF